MPNVLLVEDDAELRLLLQHVLLGANYRVDVADSVERACAHLALQHYDLVVADGRLEDGTGMAVADRASESGSKGLIITGYAFDLPPEELSRHEFLLKPVRPQELLDAVERILQSANP